MNLRDLRYFIAVAELRHFGRAAERCHVSQPTLSMQIRKLEEELGVVLFERTKRSVALTSVGANLLEHAELAVAGAQAMTDAARAHRDPLAGPLRYGAIPTLSPYLMPLILPPLKRRYERLRLVLSEEITEHLLTRLGEHEIDAALVATPVDEAEFRSRALFDEPFWLAHPRNHPLYEADEITQKDLEAVDLLLLADGHCLADQAMRVCGHGELANTGAMADLRASSLETLLQFVGAGLGCTLVPALAVRGAWMTDTGVIARQLELPNATRQVSMVWRRAFPRQEALHAVADVIIEQLPNTVTRCV